MKRPTCECGECRKCRKRIYMRKWIEANRDRWNEIQRRSHTKAYANGKRQQRDPLKRKAQHRVFTEVRAGRLVPAPCEVCGEKA
jgi:hypothetical protein